ncbi:MAG: NUDIX domain-containing protein [Saprospiraceae bacterium]|nr:NUDIX domain-containing protein [Saprospiraceae bacterium]
MYKIYINDNCLVIATQNKPQLSGCQNVMTIPYFSGKKSILNYVDKLEKATGPMTILLETLDPDQLFNDYRSLYREIRAAGGICLNQAQEILFIERLGKWDLPKGKVDKGEKKKAAAIREVSEETGQSCKIISKLGNTWHTYFDQKNRRVLKRTTWYLMELLDQNMAVKIQREENITGFKWMSATDFLQNDLPTYQSIIEIIRMTENRPISR